MWCVLAYCTYRIRTRVLMRPISICSMYVSSYYSIARTHLLSHTYYMHSSPTSSTTIWSAGCAGTGIASRQHQALYLPAPPRQLHAGPSLPGAHFTTQFNCFTTAKVRKLQHARHLPPPPRQLHASTQSAGHSVYLRYWYKFTNTDAKGAA